jgi:hypothetical protein
MKTVERHFRQIHPFSSRIGGSGFTDETRDNKEPSGSSAREAVVQTKLTPEKRA